MAMKREQFLLVKLAEEANEVSQRALKAAQFGLDEVQAGQSETNEQRLQAELSDMYGIVWMLGQDHDALIEPELPQVLAKRDKVEKYRAYSVELGMVEE
ncbi:MAG: hypothetical protein JJ979_14885 [Roseibium sp.]|nr:hypothetical protein [Roseibium sp.]